MNKKIGGISITLLMASILAGCGASVASNKTISAEVESEKSNDTSDVSSGVKKVYVAHTQTYRPFDYVNENGESDGYEVQVLKAVDEILDEYEFEYIPTTDDDLLIGVESGKYNIGVKGVWYTEERAKKFIFPEHYIGASSVGIVYKTEYADQIKDMESFASFSGKLVPIAPQNAQYNIIKGYNDEHLDNQVKLEASDAFNIADAYQWVLEGRYDAYCDIKTSFEANVVDEEGQYHQYADALTYSVYKAIPTYPLFNINNKELAAAFDKAFDKLWENGTIKDLEKQYFGEDVFQYVEE